MPQHPDSIFDKANSGINASFFQHDLRQRTLLDDSIHATGRIDLMLLSLVGNDHSLPLQFGGQYI